MPKALDGQIVMEKTPRYFVTVETPARVHAMSQDVKLIVVVRDPVTRAISDYTQIISKTPDIPPFESLAFKNRSTGTEAAAVRCLYRRMTVSQSWSQTKTSEERVQNDILISP